MKTMKLVKKKQQFCLLKVNNCFRLTTDDGQNVEYFHTHAVIRDRYRTHIVAGYQTAAKINFPAG